MTALPKLPGTHEVMNLLRARYAPPAYAFFTEVGNSTGRVSRWADGVAMGVWPSRGLHLTGFEVKASRNDWIKELRQPEKAEAVCQYCDYWYVVCGHERIVENGELPETWGLMVVRGGKLFTVTEAPKLEPQPINRRFLAALLRRVCEQSADRRAIEKARQEGVEEGRSSNKYELEKFEKLKARIAEFEKASGVDLGTDWGPYCWNEGQEIGEAVKAVLEGKHTQIKKQLEELRRDAKRIVASIEKELGMTIEESEEAV